MYSSHTGHCTHSLGFLESLAADKHSPSSTLCQREGIEHGGRSRVSGKYEACSIEYSWHARMNGDFREEPNGASTSSAMSEQGDWNKAGKYRNMKSENCVKPAGAAMRAPDDKEQSTLCARSHASTQASMHQKRVNEAYGMIVGRLENIRSNSSTLNLLIFYRNQML